MPNLKTYSSMGKLVDKIKLGMSCGEVLVILGIPHEIYTPKKYPADSRKEYWYYRNFKGRLEISFYDGGVSGIDITRYGEMFIDRKDQSTYGQTLIPRFTLEKQSLNELEDNSGID
jgi:hypothetical protein